LRTKMDARQGIQAFCGFVALAIPAFMWNSRSVVELINELDMTRTGALRLKYAETCD